MASVQMIRKDSNGQIISKNNKKNYHIIINNKIDIINVKSYKLFNKIKDEESSDDNDFFGDDETNIEKKENFIETYQKVECVNCSNRDPKAFSRCFIF